MTEMRENRSFVSAQAVARHAGVSRSAVSRTFTQGASVSEETRRKVMQAAEELGYHVNHLARGLINDRSNIVCLVAADMGAPFQARMLEVLSRRLQEIDKITMVINTSGDNDSVAHALRQTLNYRADATVVLSGSPAASLIDTCIANGQHVILINRDDHPDGPDNLRMDYAAAGREAFFLLERAGCQRIAVISSQSETPSIRGRERAFAEAAKDAGKQVIITRAGPTLYHTGIEAARQLFARADPPDGAFCVTDLLACGFMDSARHEFGVGIPDDLCVVGHDDIEQAGWESYNLTTFRQPIEQIAEQISALLVRETIPLRPEPLTFQPLPVWRKSVRPR
jgi:DNA-binding LacI/PurR family transcriptional regulator